MKSKKTFSIKKPLRVLILTYIVTDNNPRYGGEGRVVWETIHSLATTGTKVYVATSMTDFTSPLHPNITLYKIPFAKKHFLNFNQGELLKMFLFCIPLLFWRRIQVIHHLPTNGPNPFARFSFGRVFAESADPAWEYDNPNFGVDLRLDNANKSREAGVPNTTFGIWSRAAGRFFRIIGVYEKFPLGTNIFFCRTRSLVPELQKLRPESIVTYVPNGVSTKIFTPANPPLFPRTQNGLRFLHVGSISRRKGVHHLLAAFLRLLEKHPDSELFLVGRGEPTFVAELHTQATNTPQVKFFDSIPNADLPRVYTSADIFCLVPLSGSTPTVLGEAMASGLPIIGTSGSGSGEAIAEHDAGLLVPPGNEAALMGAMLQMIEHPELIQEKKEKSFAAAVSFSWEHIAQKLIVGYERALLAQHTSTT